MLPPMPTQPVPCQYTGTCPMFAAFRAKATLRVPLAGLVGELGIELDPGGLPGPWPEGLVMVGVAEGDPAVKARETVERLREDLPRMLERTQSILERTDAILGQVQQARTAENADKLVRSIDRLAVAVEREQAVARAARVLGETELLLRGVREGRGTIGRLANDPALYDRTAVLLDDLHASWAKLDALVGASARVAEKAGDQENPVNRTDAIALLGGAQNTNEECYVFNKLGRLLGTNFVEHQARL